MEAFAWLVARGLAFWFAAVIEMEWSDEEVTESLRYILYNKLHEKDTGDY